MRHESLECRCRKVTQIYRGELLAYHREEVCDTLCHKERACLTIFFVGQAFVSICFFLGGVFRILEIKSLINFVN